MIFEGLSNWATTVVLAGALATLTVLHLLRTRPREQRVITTLFWREALEQQQPRQLLHRPRQLLAWLILAATAGAIVLAISALLFRAAEPQRQHVVLIVDGGMSMSARSIPAGPTRWDEAVQSARERVAQLSTDDRICLITVDPAPRVVHRWDQPITAVHRELDLLAPSEEPARWFDAQALAHALLEHRTNPRIVLLSDRGTFLRTAAAPSAIPTESIVVGESIANAAVLSAISLIDDIDPTTCRVRVRIGAWGRSEIRIHVNGRLGRAARTVLFADVALAPGSTADLTTEPVAADGDVLTVTITETEGISADNELHLRLPRHLRLTVSADAALPAALRMGLEALNCQVNPGDAAPANLIIRELEANRTDLPEIVLAAYGPHVDAGAPLAAAPGLFEIDLHGCTTGEGGAIPPIIDGVKLTPLIESDEHILAAWSAPSAKPQQVLLASALFGRDGNFPDHPAFVLVLDRMLEILNLRDPGDVLVSAERALHDPTWFGHVAATGQVAMVVADREGSNLTQSPPAPSTAETTSAITHGPWPWASVLLAAALLLILSDAILHARGRII